MDTTYPFSYPCKTISSFWDNFFKIHIYDEIKEITYRIKDIQTNRDKIIYDLFVLFQNIYSLPVSSGWEDYKNIYFRVFGETVNKDFDWIADNDNDNLYLNLYNFSNKVQEDIKLSFLCFLYFQNVVSERFNYCVVLPPTLYNDCCSIIDENIGRYFLKGWLQELFDRPEYNLKKDVCDKFTVIKDKLSELGVIEVYLFGSVLKNRIHNSSDIDFVIKYKETIEFEEIRKIKKYIKDFNYSNFKRNTDIHEYYDFISNHNIGDTLKII